MYGPDLCCVGQAWRPPVPAAAAGGSGRAWSGSGTRTPGTCPASSAPRPAGSWAGYSGTKQQ